MDAVAPGAWKDVQVHEKGRLVARMPVPLMRKFGLTVSRMPFLTPNLGVWMDDGGGKYASRLARQKELLTALIEGMPEADIVLHTFPPESTNVLPFHWKHFELFVRYTYRLDDIGDTDRLWAEVRDSARREIRKAQKLVTVRDDLGLERFLEVNELTWARQGSRFPVPREVLQRIDAACAARDCRAILFAEDQEGRIHGALYMVWGHGVAYYLVGGSDPALRNSGAFSLLMWEAIRRAGAVARTFDFEGSMIEPIERFFRSFGARQVPYYRLLRKNRKARLLFAAKEVVDVLRGR
jgi:hypothetical protein